MAQSARHQRRVGSAHYGDRLADLVPRSRELGMREYPFPVATARLVPQMTFNVAEYARQLTEALNLRAISMVPRHDDIVIQANCGSQMVGYGVEDEAPDRAEAEQAAGGARDLVHERLRPCQARPGAIV